MYFEFDENQKALKGQAQSLFKQEIEPLVTAHSAHKPLPKDVCLRVVQLLKQLGMLGARIPQDGGGTGLGAVGLGVLLETLPFDVIGLALGTDVLITHVFRNGSQELKQKVLPALLAGEKLGADGNSEPNAGSDPRGIQTKAALVGNEYVINGTKLWSSNSTVADVILIVASTGRDEKGRSILTPFVLEKNVSPFTARILEMLGLNQGHLAEVVLEDCHVPKENMLVKAESHAHRALTAVWLSQRPLVGLASMHCAQTALGSTIRYAQEKKRYGKRVGSFQMIQGMIAEMAALTEASRLLCYKALSLIDKGVWCAKESSMAKFFATEAGVRVTSMAIQIQGAYALSQDNELQRVFRDARMRTIPAGTTEINKLILGRELLEIPAFV